MASNTEPDGVAVLLQRAGIDARAQDIPFLERTLLRQRELLRTIREQVRPDAEPAHVFKVAPASGQQRDS